MRVCYEAGPCGYALQRQLTKGRVRCVVIAPALMPRKPGDRVKTDKRDARKLAELFRAGLLTEVQPPTPAEEAVRDLCRARDDARDDSQRARHRLGKLLLRRGLHFAGKNWTKAHRRWITTIPWDQAAERAVVDDYLLALDQIESRLAELDTRLAETAQADPYREPVAWLRCFRGIDTLTAMLILAELHDFRRFPSPRALMAYLGLVPSEDSSGDRHRRGRITWKAPLGASLPLASRRGAVVLRRIVEPDLLFVAGDQQDIRTEANVQGPPALVVEILSPSTRRRDEGIKRKLFEGKGIREYWIVDPKGLRITVFRRNDAGQFPRRLELGAGQALRLETPLLPGFALAIDDLFAPV